MEDSIKGFRYSSGNRKQTTTTLTMGNQIMSDTQQAVSALNAALEYHRSGLCVVINHAPLPNGRCTCGNTECGSVGKHPVEKE